MATKKPVISIDVDDSKFKEFTALFEKYQASLDKMPSKWGKIGSSVDSVEKLTKSIGEHFERSQHALDAIAGKLDKNYKGLENTDRLSKRSADNFSDIGKNSDKLNKNVTSSTNSLLKWGSILNPITAGIGAIAGGIAIADKFASYAGDIRKQSQGLGVSAGELKSAENVYGKYTDTGSLLNNIAGAQTDINKQWAFQGTGVNPNQSAAEILPQLLKAAGEVYKQGSPETAQQRLSARGFDQLGISVEDARRMASLKKEELDATLKQYDEQTKINSITDDNLKKWQELGVSISNVGTNLMSVAVNKGAGAAGAASEILDKPNKALETYEAAINTYSLKQFGATPKDALRNMGTKARESVSGFLSLAEKNLNPGNVRYIGQKGAKLGEKGFAKFESTEEGFKALKNQLELYFTGKSKAAGYKKLDTIQDIMNLYAPSSENDTNSYANALAKSTGKDKKKHLSEEEFNDPEFLSKLMARISSVESGKNRYSPDDVKSMVYGQNQSNNPGWANYTKPNNGANIKITQDPGSNININMLTAGGQYAGNP